MIFNLQEKLENAPSNYAILHLSFSEPFLEAFLSSGFGGGLEEGFGELFELSISAYPGPRESNI